MKLIVGLGNPGDQYRHSRHNVGFGVVDLLGHRWSIELKRRKFRGRYGSGTYGSGQVMLLKPQTFMNCSGGSVAEAVVFYKVPLSDLLVIVDDMALEPGRVRLRLGGSAGGHNGLKDIIDQLGIDQFVRLRVGIGTAGPGDATSYVLGTFRPEEQTIMETAIEKAAEAVEDWIAFGIDEAMNRHNRRVEQSD